MKRVCDDRSNRKTLRTGRRRRFSKDCRLSRIRRQSLRPCLVELRNGQAVLTEEKKTVQNAARESTAAIVTYSNDDARLTNFISTLLLLQGRQHSNDESAKLQNTFGRSSFAATETRLSATGIERKTRSAFGQFSTFIALLQPDRANSVARER